MNEDSYSDAVSEQEIKDWINVDLFKEEKSEDFENWRRGLFNKGWSLFESSNLSKCYTWIFFYAPSAIENDLLAPKQNPVSVLSNGEKISSPTGQGKFPSFFT